MFPFAQQRACVASQSPIFQERAADAAEWTCNANERPGRLNHFVQRCLFRVRRTEATGICYVAVSNRLLLFGLLLFSVAARAQDRGAISGIVALSSSGEALPDVVVTIRFGPGIPRIDGVHLGNPVQTTTDRTGHFLFEDLTPGPYQLTMERAGSPGFVDSRRTTSVTVRPGSVNPQAVPLALSVSFRRTGTVAGTVRDESGKPVAGVPVLLIVAVAGPMQVVLSGSSDPRGEYRLNEVPPGKFRVLAWPERILLGVSSSNELMRQSVPTFYSRTTVERDGSVISLLGGEELNGIDITSQSSIP